GALLLTACGWWREVGFTRPSRWRNLHLAAIPLVAVLALLPGVSEVPAAKFIPYALLALLMAVQREVWFRGILFRVLVPACGARRAVTLSALLFGLAQGIDFLGGAAPGVTLVKALAAALFGYVLGALRLRTRTLWPGVAVAAIFYASTFLAWLQASGELMPPSSDRMGLLAVLGVAVFLCARYWMRRADEHLEAEAEPAQAG
ncbi:MAG TPA: CPBP family intramembrane glutamic endopeptidase, partial [Symbiobacteriaceae bacterium]|nr:CPBP family intramembrane glutamic endopeptidase [Symbiobacteriaceae bacterium]